MPVVRRDAEYAAPFETLRATDRDRLRRQPDAQAMRGAAFDIDRAVVQPGGAQYSVRDAVGRKLGPAFAPQVCVTFALSTAPRMEANSVTRRVMSPWISPTRNTVWRSPPGC